MLAEPKAGPGIFTENFAIPILHRHDGNNFAISQAPSYGFDGIAAEGVSIALFPTAFQSLAQVGNTAH
jgi:hypothetical protein